MNFIRAVAVIITIVIVLSALTFCMEKETAVNGKKSLGARTIVPPSPVWVIGSYDGEGKPNMMTASWVGICCSDPPCVTVSLRETRHSYGNIMEKRAFTVNIPSERYARETAFFGSVSGKDVDKLSATGLTAVKSGLVDAPYLEEFPLAVECKLIKTVELGAHTMFIGEIMDVKVSESVLGEKGMPDIEKLRPFIFNPGSPDFYSTGGSIGRISDLGKEIKK